MPADEAGDDVGGIGPLAQGALAVRSIIQNSMKKYCFKQNWFKLVHSSDKQKGDELQLLHNSHDPSLMQPDHLHIEDEPNLN